MLNDPELKAAVNAVGVHYPLVNGKYTTPANARTIGKPLWSSEDQPNSRRRPDRLPRVAYRRPHPGPAL